MRAAVLYGPRDVRIDDRPDPHIIEPTDAVIRLSATCICGSDLWPYRGLNAASEPAPMGHEYCGIVEEVGRAVTSIKPGQFVIGSFAASDNTCPHCRAGYQTSCAHRQWVVGAQAPFLRVPMADGTLVATQSRNKIAIILIAGCAYSTLATGINSYLKPLFFGFFGCKTSRSAATTAQRRSFGQPRSSRRQRALGPCGLARSICLGCS